MCAGISGFLFIRLKNSDFRWFQYLRCTERTICPFGTNRVQVYALRRRFGLLNHQLI